MPSASVPPITIVVLSLVDHNNIGHVLSALCSVAVAIFGSQNFLVDARGGTGTRSHQRTGESGRFQMQPSPASVPVL